MKNANISFSCRFVVVVVDFLQCSLLLHVSELVVGFYVQTAKWRIVDWFRIERGILMYANTEYMHTTTTHTHTHLQWIAIFFPCFVFGLCLSISVIFRIFFLFLFSLFTIHVLLNFVVVIACVAYVCVRVLGCASVHRCLLSYSQSTAHERRKIVLALYDLRYKWIDRAKRKLVRHE